MVQIKTEAQYKAALARIETLRLRMYERGLNQQKIAALLGISAPRMSEIMNGKAEPSLALARTMCQKLEIQPEVVVGL